MSRESDERAYHEKHYLDSAGGYPPPLHYDPPEVRRGWLQDPPAILGGQGRTASELRSSASWLGLLLALVFSLLAWYCVLWLGGALA